MKIIIIVFLFCISLVIYMLKEAFKNKVIERDLLFKEFPPSFGKVSIFFISDIHRRIISEKIIAAIKGKTDIVIIGGDLTEKGVPLERVKENLKKLKEVSPVYFVWGNNDYEVDYHELDATMLELGVKIIDNTSVSFESENGDKLVLLGIDDISLERDRLDLALSDAEVGGFRVLVSHNPRVMDQILPEHNIHLVLSGHTHGGQIHILGYSPYEKGGIKKDQEKDVTLLVSNGYGTTALPLRLGAPAETHLITLKNG
jgi:uncharacterized protein